MALFHLVYFSKALNVQTPVDVIIPEGGMNPVAYGMIIQKISAHLAL